MRFSPRILYVDDDKDSCELMGLLLQQDNENYQTVLVGSVEKALSLIKDTAFDLYILDYMLPRISGVELCRMIRGCNAAVPIMFFTAMAQASDRAAAMDAGANAYLVKPNDLDVFTPTVRRLLEESAPFPVSKSEPSVL